ncbi:MAG: hypothetical protein KF837_30145 [Labilithrix sp.]|nr:hypothetical protein [Labilithrix sp.]
MAVLAILVGAVACSDDAPASSPPAREAVDAGPKPVPVSPVDTSEPPPPPVSDALPCPKSPCAERPVIFIHGHTGSIDDGKVLLDRMLVEGERWDDWQPVGTEDHQAWEAKSVPRRSWLFNFDYYVKHAKTDKRGSYTAGPGRIGSNGDFTCAAPAGKGHIRPSATVYDDGTEHEFANDLAQMVDSVLRATGAAKVDIVTHSMGGLVTRSFITFVGGAEKVESVLFLATPHLGVPFASAEAIINEANKPWMSAKELAELDRNGVFAQTKFMPCGESGTDTWPNLLLAAEEKLPRAPAYRCMRGVNDVLVSEESGRHPSCVEHVELPSTDHAKLPAAKEASDLARRVLGGFVTASTKL